MAFFIFLAFVILLISYIPTVKEAIRQYVLPKDGQYYHDDYQQRHELFTAKVNYYRYLTDKQKLEFHRRVRVIENSKSFSFTEDFQYEDWHGTLLSAKLACLTFGYLTYFHLPELTHIQIHPRAFYSRIFQTYVKGLTFSNGILHVSWEDFMASNDNELNKINLAIHEFAHALKIGFDHFSGNYSYERWEELALEIIELINTDQEDFFREYGGTNINEFWAVCCEAYFEQPFHFKELYPRLYRETCGILRQDFVKQIVKYEANFGKPENHNPHFRTTLQPNHK